MGTPILSNRQFARRYTVEREIGRGATATVYLARDAELGHSVAIKLLRTDVLQAGSDERFLREIRVTMALRHPRILPVLDAGSDGTQLFFVLPYMDGGTLRERLRQEAQLPIDDALVIAKDIAEALDYAHQQGLIHRDVKPENILFSEGKAHLADFGIARALENAMGESSTSTGIIRGTAAYMSPEQAGGSRAYDGRSDLFSLGCVLYEMLAGVPAFIGPTPESVVAQRLMFPPRELRVYRPAVPPQLEATVNKALAVSAADRFRSAAEMANALGRVQALETSNAAVWAKPRRKRMARGLGVVAVAALATAAALWRWTGTPPALDDSLIAVAPFDVYDSRLSLWREGYMDVLAGSLDGAGRLRTVSPTVSMRRWQRPAQRSSAMALATSTGARYIVYGRVMPSGTDSIRATATVLDARNEREITTVDVRDAFDRPDRLGDSLAVKLVSELGELGEAPNVRNRARSLGAASLPALKAYLRGEYHLRRSQFDSAAIAYGEALSHDSLFALAHWRMKYASEWRSWGPATVGDEHALRAGQLNRGLAPRESLSIVVDSLWASITQDDPGQWRRVQRIRLTLDEAVRRYPEDPWIWFKIGEARFHLPIGLDYTVDQHLEAFDRAIALDSGFALPYVNHVLEMALILHGPERALRYTRGFKFAALPGVEDSAATLTARLLDSELSRSSETTRILDSASADVLYRVAANLDMWFDPDETAVHIARRLVASTRGSRRFLDRETRHLRLARILSIRGHLGEAWQQLQNGVALNPPADETIELFTDLAVLHAVPPPTADSVFRLWVRTSPRGSIFALSWFAQRRDTLALARATQAMGRWSRSQDRGRLGAYGVQAAGGYLALARGDSATATRQLSALQDSLCADCYQDWLVRGQLLLAQREYARAKRQFERVQTYAWNVPTYVLASLGLGRIGERTADRALAQRAYGVVAAAFQHADPALRRLAAEADSSRRHLQR